jgi:hypothetical protein
MTPRGIPLLEKGAGREVLKRHCRAARLPIQLFDQLVEEELRQQGKARRHGLFENFDHILEDALQEDLGDGGDNAASLGRTA